MTRGAYSPPGGRQSGASLLETLVALTIMAVAILWTMILLVEAPRIERRLEAHQEAERLMEILLEKIRSGPFLPPDGEVRLSDLSFAISEKPPPTEDEGDLSQLPFITTARDLRMSTKVELETGRGLRKLTITVHYYVGGVQYNRQLETLVFVPVP